jgi:hypothetical protein
VYRASSAFNAHFPSSDSLPTADRFLYILGTENVRRCVPSS